LATTDRIEEFLTTFRGRVAALAAIHNTMAQSNWTSVDLLDLVGSSLAPFGEAPRVRAKGDAIQVTLDTGKSFGMILHELATNAAKYGSLSTSEGKVSVRWRRENHGGNSTLIFEWIESGGPPVRQTSRRGYGLKLIENLVPYELGGKADVRFAETGLRCEIVVPLDDVVLESRQDRNSDER
jgi:two-component sensor histidine kinase